MYISDYIYTYSNGVDNACYTDGYSCKTSGIPASGWLFNSATGDWSIDPYSHLSADVFIIYISGGISSTHGVSNEVNSRPCVYLRSDIQIIGGDGSSDNPYILGD